MLYLSRTAGLCSSLSRSVMGVVRILCVITITLHFLFGQKNVVSLSPTFDFDGDGLSEFLALEKQNFDDIAPSSAVFYEIDDFGSHMELWRHTTLDQIIKAEIGDVDGNTIPDIVLLSRSSFLEVESQASMWLKAFHWTQIDFSPTPIFSFNSMSDSLYVRPSSFTLLDIYNDNGKDAILFAQGSPSRSISINSISENEAFDKIKSLFADSLSAGYAPIHLTKFDYNANSSLDIIAISPEETNIRIQVFLNKGGELSSGIFKKVSYPVDLNLTRRVDTSMDLIPSGIINADIDFDGFDELVIPFKSASVVVLDQQGSNFSSTTINPKLYDLFFFSRPLTESDINNILLSRAELGIGTDPLQNFTLNEVPIVESAFDPLINQSVDSQKSSNQTNMEDSGLIASKPIATMRLSAIPVVGSSKDESSLNSSAIVNGASGQLKEINISSFDNQLGNSASSSPSLSSRPSGRMKQISLSNLGSGPGSPTITSDTAYVEKQFIYPVIPSKGTLAQFRTINMPEGAIYNPSTKNIVWTPSEDQIGLHKFEFQMMIQGGGNRPVVDEVRGQGVTVRSTTKDELVVIKVVVVE